MKPQPGLTENGEKIFNELVKHTQQIGDESIDAFQLTNLAQAFDLAERCRQKINFPKDKKQSDGVQTTENGYTQVTGYVTVMDKCNTQIEKIGAKFGITPADRSKIAVFANQKPEKKSALDKY